MLSQLQVPQIAFSLFKVNKGNSEKFSKLTIKALEQSQRRRSGIFISNFEEILCIVLEFPLLTLNM